jgi:hypothetical protein
VGDAGLETNEKSSEEKRISSSGGAENGSVDASLLRFSYLINSANGKPKKPAQEPVPRCRKRESPSVNLRTRFGVITDDQVPRYQFANAHD